MRNFANLIAKNRMDTPDPNLKTFDKTSYVGKGATALGIKLPITPEYKSNLDTYITKAENGLKSAKDYPTRMQFKELYNHLKSIKRWNESSDFNNRAEQLVGKLNNLLPGLEVLPEFKTASEPTIRTNTATSSNA